MQKALRIGTRDSQLAVWQATLVKDLLAQHGYAAELVYIKSDGDIDLKTPLYEMGVQGIFTRSLDIAMLEGRIDLAVHSMKDVPTQLPKGIVQAAVLERASYKDLLVFKGDEAELNSKFKIQNSKFALGTSSIRRQAQWLNRYPNSTIENLRGNINTRLRKVEENNWDGAIFAAAGLERINLRPERSLELDWMLPAPAQGAIMVVCKEDDDYAFGGCRKIHDEATAICTRAERDFLRALMGGCSMPISALAEIKGDQLNFQGNILSADGKQKAEVRQTVNTSEASNIGWNAAQELLKSGGQAIIETFRNEGK